MIILFCFGLGILLGFFIFIRRFFLYNLNFILFTFYFYIFQFRWRLKYWIQVHINVINNSIWDDSFHKTSIMFISIFGRFNPNSFKCYFLIRVYFYCVRSCSLLCECEVCSRMRSGIFSSCRHGPGFLIFVGHFGNFTQGYRFYGVVDLGYLGFSFF